MPPLRETTARGLALRVLLECAGGEHHVQERLNEYLNQAALQPADRRLATQLAYGTMRRRGTLDALLTPLSNRQLGSLDPVVLEALRLGAFQLALMANIPPHAALNESVELVEARKVRGYVNGVLRALSRLLTDEHTSAPAADALPLEKGQYRRLAKRVLPDPLRDPVRYLAAGFALPDWLADRWLKRLGWEESLRLGFWFAGPVPLWLRCNSLHTNREAFLEALHHAGLAATAGEHPQAVRVEEPAAIRSIPGYEQGWFTVQDASAMRVASALDPLPGSRVLDLCAAPGGKTTHLAELMRNQGSITACDLEDERLQTLTALCARLGITIVDICRLGKLPKSPGTSAAWSTPPPPGPFDAALVDVPCSNTGVLGKRPEVRWRLRPGDFDNLVRLQRWLLTQALERVKLGGVVVYSTCSIEPEENGDVVRAVLGSVPGVILEGEEEQVPGRPADGGYWARLRRTGPAVISGRSRQ